MTDVRFVLPQHSVLARSKSVPGIIHGTGVITKDSEKGGLVSQLQVILKELCYADLEENGIFGESTETALKEFQKEHQQTDSKGRKTSLNVDGIVGAEVAKALNLAVQELEGAINHPIAGTTGRLPSSTLKCVLKKAVPVRIKNLFFTKSGDLDSHLNWDNILGFDEGLDSVGIGLEAGFVDRSGLPPVEIKVTLTRRHPKEGGGYLDNQAVTKPIRLTYRPDLSMNEVVKYSNKEDEQISLDKLPTPTEVKPTLASVRRKRESSDLTVQSDQSVRDGLGNDGFVNRGMGVEGLTDPKREIPDAKTLFLSAGVEVLEIGIDSQSNVENPLDLKSKVLIHSPAHIFYYTGHGHSNLRNPAGTLVSLDNLDPETVIKTWKRANNRVQTLVLAGCSVLGIHHLKWKHEFDPGTFDGVGMRWAQMLPQKEALVDEMIGYWGAGPKDAEGGNEIAEKLGKAISARKDSTQAWMDINLGNREGGTACTLRGNDFKFIEEKDGGSKRITTGVVFK